MKEILKRSETPNASNNDSIVTYKEWSSKRINERRRSAVVAGSGNKVILEAQVASVRKSSFSLDDNGAGSRRSSHSGIILQNSTSQKRQKGPLKRRQRNMKRGDDRVKVAVRVRPFISFMTLQR
ncbi:unnamed protein product [Clavelina lepadiformis]|uniref:Uncharacterized protein n=1 Tax=Clavelina lepadiformis TaxID=159417 RepID=A0ABP0FT86_CLALP